MRLFLPYRHEVLSRIRKSGIDFARKTTINTLKYNIFIRVADNREIIRIFVTNVTIARIIVKLSL